MLDLTDFGHNPAGREVGEYGTPLVRHGKAKKGSPPKRRSVLTAWHWTPRTIEEWINEARPGCGIRPAGPYGRPSAGRESGISGCPDSPPTRAPCVERARFGRGASDT
ncbi:hypothetical protein ACFQ60_02565 [Streptomyces zhihengii]